MSMPLLTHLRYRINPRLVREVALAPTSSTKTYKLILANRPQVASPLGLLDVKFIRDYSLHILFLCSLASEDYKGVGRALHEGAFRLSQEHGLEGRVTLNSYTNLIPFHERCGYTVTPFQDSTGNLMTLTEEARIEWLHNLNLSE
ncbi:MAG: hypothetical protein SP1CHLAM54_03800 [Chlamydiia bacterium]|nr:hypothetical protein [Chlamydiia bacterium]MCH9615295.1 hypothetical protein [Chlamydiia bacterium]MCH9628383.1 hypothetical protein [Chlamydiia bacterium]